jgi:hypothetical protein
LKGAICRCCKKKGHIQDKCFTHIRKGLLCVDANGVPLKTQPPTLPQQGWVAEIGPQMANLEWKLKILSPLQVFQPLPSLMVIGHNTPKFSVKSNDMWDDITLYNCKIAEASSVHMPGIHATTLTNNF